MEKTEAKALTNAIMSLIKTQQEQNKQLDKLVRVLTDQNTINDGIRTRLLTLSTSVDKLTEKYTVNS